jgi:hypothetical protein
VVVGVVILFTLAPLPATHDYFIFFIEPCRSSVIVQIPALDAMIIIPFKSPQQGQGLVNGLSIF